MHSGTRLLHRKEFMLNIPWVNRCDGFIVIVAAVADDLPPSSCIMSSPCQISDVRRLHQVPRRQGGQGGEALRQHHHARRHRRRHRQAGVMQTLIAGADFWSMAWAVQPCRDGSRHVYPPSYHLRWPRCDCTIPILPQCWLFLPKWSKFLWHDLMWSDLVEGMKEA